MIDYEPLGDCLAQGQGRACDPLARDRRAQPLRSRRRGRTHVAVRRARPRAQAPTGHLRTRRARVVDPARHDHRRARCRQDEARLRAPRPSSMRQPELVFWRQGRCLPYGEGITFWALGEMVKAQAGILESDDPALARDEAGGRSRRRRRGASERDWLEARLAPLVGAGAGGETGRRQRSPLRPGWPSSKASRRSGRWCSSSRTCTGPTRRCWSSSSTWSTGRAACRCSCSARRARSCTSATPAGAAASATRRRSRCRRSRTTTLHASSALCWSAPFCPAETQRALLDQAGGNPLYAEEFVRMLTDRGILTRRGSGLEVEADGEIPVPATVQALIEARLDTLRPSARRCSTTPP